MLKSGIPVMITKKNVLLVIDPLYPNINNATINIISFPMYILIQKATICSNSKKLPIKVPSVSEWKYIIASASKFKLLCQPALPIMGKAQASWAKTTGAWWIFLLSFIQAG